MNDFKSNYDQSVNQIYNWRLCSISWSWKCSFKFVKRYWTIWLKSSIETILIRVKDIMWWSIGKHNRLKQSRLTILRDKWYGLWNIIVNRRKTNRIISNRLIKGRMVVVVIINNVIKLIRPIEVWIRLD